MFLNVVADDVIMDDMRRSCRNCKDDCECQKFVAYFKSCQIKQYRALVFVCLRLYKYNLVMNTLSNVCKYVTG